MQNRTTFIGTAERKAHHSRIGTEETGTGRKPAEKAGDA